MYRIPRAELLEILGRVSYGLSARGSIAQSSCFVFEDGWVITNNAEICCRTKTGLPDEFVGAVDAAPLMKVLETITPDEVRLSLSDTRLTVHYGAKSQAWVRRQPEILLPTDQVGTPEKWNLLPEDFGKAVEQVVGVAGRDEAEFLCVCVNITPDWLEACDRKQAVRHQMVTGVEKPFLVRAKSLAPTANLGLTKVGTTDQWVHFRNKSLVYSCCRHIEAFPSDVITGMFEFRGTEATLPQGAKEAALVSGAFSGDDAANDRVVVSISDGQMEVRSSGLRGGASVPLPMDYHGEPIQFRISPKTLVSIVESYSQCEVGPGKLTVRGEGWQYLVLLSPVEEEPTPVLVGADGDEESEPEDEE